MGKLAYGHICVGGVGDMIKCVRESLNRIVKKDKDTRSALNKAGSGKHLQPHSELHYPISTRVIASWLVRGYIVFRMRWYEFGNRAICQCMPGKEAAAAMVGVRASPTTEELQHKEGSSEWDRRRRGWSY